MTSILTFIKKLYSNCLQTDAKKMWVRVPNTCANREDKDLIIYSTLDFLEHNIKIIEHE